MPSLKLSTHEKMQVFLIPSPSYVCYNLLNISKLPLLGHLGNGNFSSGLSSCKRDRASSEIVNLLMQDIQTYKSLEVSVEVIISFAWLTCRYQLSSPRTASGILSIIRTLDLEISGYIYCRFNILPGSIPQRRQEQNCRLQLGLYSLGYIFLLSVTRHD
jgi:hypothetical protein